VRLHGLEELLLEFGELPDPEHRRPADQMGHPDLGIAVLARVEVEHEGRECSFQARGRSPEHREARFRDLGGPLEIEEAERFADFVMGLRREGKLSRLPPLSDLGIVLAAGADWHRWMRQVRKLQEEVLDLLVDRLDVTVQRLDAIADLAHARLLGRRVLPPALGLPDGLRGAIPQRLEILGLLEETTARG